MVELWIAVVSQSVYAELFSHIECDENQVLFSGFFL